MERADGRGSQSPSGAAHRGQTICLADRDPAAAGLPVLLGTNPLVTMKLVQSGGKPAPWGLAGLLCTDPLGSPGPYLPSLGLGFLFYSRDHYYGFIGCPVGKCFVPISSAKGRARLDPGAWGPQELLLPLGLLKVGKCGPLGCRVADGRSALVPRSLSVRAEEGGEARCGRAFGPRPSSWLRRGHSLSQLWRHPYLAERAVC